MTEENKVFSAAPTDERVPEEKAAYELLDRLGVAYTRTDHPVVQTMEDCQRAEELLGVKICKNLFLCNRQKTSFYLLMMPGDKPFKTKDLSAQIGSARLSFAGEEFMKELLGVAPGSVSVLGLMNDHDKKVRLLIEKDILKDEYFGCHPCKNTSSMKIRVSDLTDVILPAVGHDYTEVVL